MKIAFSTKDDTLLSRIDPDFEHSRFFLILNPNDLSEYECILNPFRSQKKDCGAQCAQLLIQRGVQVLITGKCRINAVNCLREKGIQVREGISGEIMNIVMNLHNYRFSA